MTRFFACRAEIHYDDDRPVHEDDDALVDLDDGVLICCYWDDDGAVVFEGREDEPGRFTLKARSRPRVACLVHSVESGVMEGTWQERDDTGRIRIELGEEGQKR